MRYMPNYRILPEDSIIIRRFSAYHSSLKLDQLIAKLDVIPERNPKFVFIDYSPDPIPPYTDEQIQERIALFKRNFPNSRVVLLSAQSDDYDTDQPDVLFYPYAFLNHYDEYPVVPRKKRIGCLNRRNAPHRIWMMHKLLSEGLLDHERDIFSVSFTNVYNKMRANMSDWKPPIPIEEQRYINTFYPDTIATLPDDFPNDHSVQHPAWNTAVAIVTETEVGDRAFPSEKTVKALLSRSCWMLYAGAEEFKMLTKMGFEIGTFDEHPTGYNIDPILKMCRELDTESAALDYYHSKIDIINHNAEWVRHGWLTRYQEKLKPFIE